MHFHSRSASLSSVALTCFVFVVGVFAAPETHATNSTNSSDLSSRIEVLLQDPEQARLFDYCEWRFEANGEESELPDFELLLDRKRTTLTPSVEAAHALVDAGTKIAMAADKRKRCEAHFTKGQRDFDAAFDKVLRKIDRRGPQTPSSDPVHAEIQKEIIRLWREDQAARRAYVSSRTDDKEGADFWHRRVATAHVLVADSESTDYIKEVLEQVDWVDIPRFGEDIAAHAWILVQHADAHPELQIEVLERMSKYLDNGGVRKRDYAYLWDRVAVNQNRVQRYGTQPDWTCKPGGLTLMPLEDEGKVDALRSEMGLGPVREALDEMTKSVCGRGLG